MYQKLAETIQQLQQRPIPQDRIELMQPMITFLQTQLQDEVIIHLNFICTHNSRRSQLAQVWGQTAAYQFDLPIICHSSGTEVTAFNERAVDTLESQGFAIQSEGESNPTYHLQYVENGKEIIAYSKSYEDVAKQEQPFIAVMTCDHADQNCPFIPGAAARFSLNYEDPKAFDGTEKEKAQYLERSNQIGSELFYIMSTIKSSL